MRREISFTFELRSYHLVKNIIAGSFDCLDRIRGDLELEIIGKGHRSQLHQKGIHRFYSSGIERDNILY